jgi:hypothetical protein
MSSLEFYSKYKTSYRPIVNPVFSKGNWWRIALIAAVAILIGPLILYKNERTVTFSINQYLQLSEYFVIIVVPFVSFLIWANLRELTKRRRGYVLVGKFEVINKRSAFGFHFLHLTPGNNNQVRVKRVLFEKTNPGDFILIRRDAFGSIEEITRINNVSGRLAKIGGKRVYKSGDARSFHLNHEDDDHENEQKFDL